jgi:hypothetical protein
MVEIANKASTILETEFAIEAIPGPAVQYDLVFDTSKVRRLTLDIQFRTLEEGIAEYAGQHDFQQQDGANVC